MALGSVLNIVTIILALNNVQSSHFSFRDCRSTNAIQNIKRITAPPDFVLQGRENISHGNYCKKEAIIQVFRRSVLEKKDDERKHSHLKCNDNKISKRCAWRIPGFCYVCGLSGLHQDIEHFNAYISPTSTEASIRNKIVRKVKTAIHAIWKDAKVEVFGSFRTGLYLPTSDIDMIVMGIEDQTPLQTLTAALISRGIVEKQSVEIVQNATVPIIKSSEYKTQVKLDISFSEPSGINSAELINKYKQEFPVLGKLVMVLKQFLRQRDLNNSHTGGLSSYSVTLFCVSFLQSRFYLNQSDSDNLGLLLLEFFDLYGRKFDYFKNCISIKTYEGFIPKDIFQRHRINELDMSILCIEDPLTLGKNVGLKTLRIMEVKQAFAEAYAILSEELSLGSSLGKDCSNNSILCRLVQISDEDIEYRKRIRDYFES